MKSLQSVNKMQRKTKLSNNQTSSNDSQQHRSSLPFDLKTITFNICHLSPSLVIGKYQIRFWGRNASSFSSVHSENSVTRWTWEKVVSVQLHWQRCTICAMKGFANLQSFCVTINILKTFFASKILLIVAGFMALHQLTVSRKPTMEMMIYSVFQCMLWWNGQTKMSTVGLY